MIASDPHALRSAKTYSHANIVAPFRFKPKLHVTFHSLHPTTEHYLSLGNAKNSHAIQKADNKIVTIGKL
jgi:hypothetical protein